MAITTVRAIREFFPQSAQPGERNLRIGGKGVDFHRASELRLKRFVGNPGYVSRPGQPGASPSREPSFRERHRILTDIRTGEFRDDTVLLGPEDETPLNPVGSPVLVSPGVAE
jgi:hypothetical protein